MINDFRIILKRKYLNRFVLIFIGGCFAAFLEMLSLGSIPIFVGFISSPEVIINKLPLEDLKAYIYQIDKNKLIFSLSAFVLLAFIVKNLFLSLLIYYEFKTTYVIRKEIITKFYSYYINAPYEFHLRNNPAQLNRNITYEVTQAINSIIFILNLFREFLVIAVLIFLLFIVEPKITLLSFAILSASVLFFFYIIKSFLKQRAKQSQILRKKIIQMINQSFGSIKDLKILLKEKALEKKFETDVNIYEKNTFFYQVISKTPRIFLEIVSLTLLVVVVAFFLMLGRNLESILPTLSLLAIAMVRLIPAFNSISTALSNLRINTPNINLVAKEIKEIKIFKQSAYNIYNEKKIFKNNLNTGEELLSLENVTYSFPNTNFQSIKNITLKIKKGESVGFTGITGSGKSTLFHIMLGLLKPQQGTVKFNGVEIYKNLFNWRNQVGYISQNVYLNDDTIKNNIIFGNEDDEVNEVNLKSAIKNSGLSDFLETLPKGLNTTVGSDGIRLSGGQKQRIGIARSLYKKPEILFMDESTSSLDYKTEESIINKINTFSKDRTLIIIAHRLSTIKNCVVYLLDQGRIIDQGKFFEIEKRNNLLNKQL